MSAVRAMLILLALPAGALARQTHDPASSQPSSGDAPQFPVIRLAVQAPGTPIRALRYNLLPRRGELQPGNAATLWVRAGQAARDVTKKLNYDWVSPAGTPLKDLPKKEVRAALDTYAAALRLAEEAATRDHCAWDIPPFRLDHWDFPFAELQGCRELAQVLSVRCRLQLSEADFDGAAQTLRTGFALARHLGDSDTMIQALVGIAVAHVMFGHVEEWIQVPGSPNLYWPLAALPNPFIDVRRAMEFEFDNIDHAFPELRRVRKTARDPAQVDAVVEELCALLARVETRPAPEWQVRLAMAALAAKFYPDARRRLLDSGYPADAVDALSPVQVVLVEFLEQNDRHRDDVVKALSLPTWQAQAQLEAVTRRVNRLRSEFGNPFITLLFPAVAKVFEARVRAGTHGGWPALCRGATAIRG